MTCSCPKCHAQIEIDLSRIPENGTFTPCPECKSRFWINKESFARMALKKEGKSYCDKCGKELAHIIVCAACGVMYPDYYLVQASKPPLRQVEKPDLFSVGFTLRPAVKQNYIYTGGRKTEAGPSKSLFLKIGMLALVALLAAGTSFYIHIKKMEQLYARNYMRALYTMKVGTDLSLNTCAKLSAEWKTSMDAGRNYTPHISTDDESRLNSVKDTTDRFMQTLNEPPKKFIGSKEKLANLYGMFTKAYTLAVTPSGSLSSFTESSGKSQNDFNAAVQDLKGGLPPELSAELKIAKAKYKGLKEI
jgi:ribosomal protein L33